MSRFLVTFENSSGESHTVEVEASGKDAASDQVFDEQDDVDGISNVEEIE